MIRPPTNMNMINQKYCDCKPRCLSLHFDDILKKDICNECGKEVI